MVLVLCNFDLVDLSTHLSYFSIHFLLPACKYPLLICSRCFGTQHPANMQCTTQRNRFSFYFWTLMPSPSSDILHFVSCCSVCVFSLNDESFLRSALLNSLHCKLMKKMKRMYFFILSICLPIFFKLSIFPLSLVHSILRGNRFDGGR